MTKDEHIGLFELNQRIKQSIKNTFPSSVWIVAEIGQIQENISGHCYLDLIEKDEKSDKIVARNKATIWAYTYRMLKPFFETSTKKRFSIGLKILVNCAVEYHEQYGLSLSVRDIDPTYTVGDIAMRKQIVISQLEEEGVLEMNKELELPTIVKRLAIVSSSTAAGYGDFMDQLTDNAEEIPFSTCLFHASMQGDEAPKSIMEAFDRIYENIDLFDAVVVIRGGGASLDLSCFDDYDLAYYATQFPLPVIAGIGHDRDESVLDLVAHTSLKTPTAVAAFFVDKMSAQLGYVLDMEEQIIHLVKSNIENAKYRFRIATQKIPVVAKQYIFQHENRINRVDEKLKKLPQIYINQSKDHLSRLEKRVVREAPLLIAAHNNKLNHTLASVRSAALHRLQTSKQKLAMFEEVCKLQDPQNVLKKGYSITTKNGKAIKVASNLHSTDVITTRLYDGEVSSIVKSIKETQDGEK